MNLELNSELATFTPVSLPTDKKIDAPLKALTFYQQELKKNLPEAIFKRAPSRVLYLVSFLSLNIFLIYCVVHFNPA